MDQPQDNITTMFETTNGVLDENNSLWSGVPAFADAVSRVKDGAAAIRQRQGEQVKTGHAEMKQAARDAVEEQALVIGSQLSALAAKTGDAELDAKVSFDKSRLDRMAVSDLLTAAKAIADAATANEAALASDYDIQKADRTKFDDAITKLEGLKDKPRESVVTRKVATMALPTAISHVRGIYRNELDKMMTKFKTPAPDFYSRYFGARIIIDRPGKHKAKKTPTPPKP